MLEEHMKWRMLDKNGKQDFYCEVNWKEDDPLVNECKVFKFTFPDGTEAFVERKHMLEMLFACGNPEEQMKMIPQTLTRQRWYETTVGVTATKDIRKGEKIVFPIKLSLPDERQEIIGKIPKRRSPLAP